MKIKPNTALPWKHWTNDLGVSAFGPDGSHPVGRITSSGPFPSIGNEKNAAFIVTACNAYSEHVERIDALSNALREFVRLSDERKLGNPLCPNERNRAVKNAKAILSHESAQ